MNLWRNNYCFKNDGDRKLQMSIKLFGYRIMAHLNPERREYDENNGVSRMVVNNHGCHSPTDATIVRD